MRNGVEGPVVVELTSGEEGEVIDARILSGPEELRKETLLAVLQWKYAPGPTLTRTVQVTIFFRLPQAE